MRFFYKAQTLEGEITEGEADAEDRSALIEHMRAEKKTLIFLESIDKRGFEFIARVNGFLSKVHLKEKIFFCRNVSIMLSAGLSIARALAILGRQTKNERLKQVLRGLSDSIMGGSSLEQAMRVFPDVFSPLTIAMVRAGEASGSLPESLKIIAQHLEQSYLLQKRVRGALIYPGVIVCTMVVIGVIMMVYVVPTLSSTFSELNVPLPFMTKAIMWLSDFLRNNGIIVFVLALAVVGLFFFIFRQKWGKSAVQALSLCFPIIRDLVIKMNVARVVRTLSSLLLSGVSMLDAVVITQDVAQNVHYKKVLQEAREKIQKGIPLSEVFSTHERLFPIMVGEMVAVGEETGKLSDMLSEVARFYEEDVEQFTKNFSTVIEPVLMVLVGAAVGLFAYSMITPMYSVVGSI